MRAFVILLLLCAIVSAGIFDKSKIKEKIKDLKGKLTSNVKTALDKLKKKFNTTALADFREKLAGLKDKIKSKLTLTKEKMAEVAERLKLVRRKNVDKVQPGGDNIDDINLNVGVGEALYQGDIALTKQQSEEIVEGIIDDGRSKRQAFRDKRYPDTTWPRREVPYFFDENTGPSTRSVFKKAAMEWQKDTCLSIYEDKFKDAKDAIRVFEEDGCWSYVGKTGGKQDLSLGKGCDSIGTAAHELGHALGFFHTHSRHDRDNNIIVVTNNIKDDWLDQFTLENKERNNNYGLPYDYGSLLQYGATSAIKEKGKPNMYSMVPNTTLYIETLGSPFISFIDLYMMNIHYNCTEKCPKVSWARCRNHGFPHPRDCSRCICPGGYGGDYCDEKPRGCGKVLEAKPTAQVFEDTVGVTTDTKVREDFMKCYYWITAPQGKKIQVRLLKFQPQGIAVDGCTYGGVEFKWQADQRLTGSRHCSKDDEGLVFNSTSNLMPIITYNRIYATMTKIEYKYV
ncbi:hypothetical protein Q1695_008055 [Nippostrongylus brasiliensis]|nr:hypothetical protein Q1695_008053 [Nippostrongylus brasiliensis]WKX88130.1 hypothetical protein Q1695_008055 [Nippostrongylus brasiliensis]